MGQIIPVPSSVNWKNNFAFNDQNTWGTTITAHATIHTKGNWTELIASADYDVYGFWLMFMDSFASSTNTAMLLDIGIGGAGSEQVILPNFLAGWAPTAGSGANMFYVPLFIPAGSRVAARCQAAITVDAVLVTIVLEQGTDRPHPIFQGCDAIGVDTATSRGTFHTPGASGAESTAANIGSTTARDYGAILFTLQGTDDTILNSTALQFSLVVGAQAVARWYARSFNTEYTHHVFPPAPIRRRIPAGTQLQVSGSCHTGSEPIDVAFYGFY